MVAVPVGREPMSLIDSMVLWAAKRRARSGRGKGSGAFGWWLGELTGTLAAFAALVFGAFQYAPPFVAWVVLAVVLLALDAKVSGARRDRRQARIPAAAVTSSNRFVRE